MALWCIFGLRASRAEIQSLYGNEAYANSGTEFREDYASTRMNEGCKHDFTVRMKKNAWVVADISRKTKSGKSDIKCNGGLLK